MGRANQNVQIVDGAMLKTYFLNCDMLVIFHISSNSAHKLLILTILASQAQFLAPFKAEVNKEPLQDILPRLD